MTALIFILSLLASLLIAVPLTAAVGVGGADHHPSTPHREKMDTFVQKGEFQDLLNYCEQVEDKHGTLQLDDIAPSLYSYKGVSLYMLHRYEEASESFTRAVNFYNQDLRSWINLGESYMLSLNFKASLETFEKAFQINPEKVVSRVLASKLWTSSWKDLEYYVQVIEKMGEICRSGSEVDCELESSSGLELTRSSLAGECDRILHGRLPSTVYNPKLKIVKKLPPLWDIPEAGKKVNRKLRIGFLSSDFDVHPVSSLIRGTIQFIDKKKYDVFVFSIAPKVSWWGLNVSREATGFIFLHSMNTFDAATLITANKIEILIELNGHTKGTGLNYLAHRPAPIQISYLGLPITTSAHYIDYYIGDYVALPPENRHHFTEHLGLMKPCYIANDYAQVQGGVVTKFSGKNRASRKALNADFDVMDATILFGTVSNSQKIDPLIFHVWMNVLNRFTGSKLVFHDHKGMAQGVEHMREYAQSFGIEEHRLALAELAPWIDHLYRKTSIDMMLDTVVKNGHTTGLDGYWAGVPTVTMGGGATMPSRAAESIVTGLGNELGLSYSLKEYEDIVMSFARRSSKARYSSVQAREICISSIIYEEGVSVEDCMQSANEVISSLSGTSRLATWRSELEKLRLSSHLFDTMAYSKQFSYLLQAKWEVHHIKGGDRKFHIFPSLSANIASADADASADAASDKEKSMTAKHLSQMDNDPTSGSNEYAYMKIDNIGEYAVVDELNMSPKYDFKYYLNDPTKELSDYLVVQEPPILFGGKGTSYQAMPDEDYSNSNSNSNSAGSSGPFDKFFLKSLPTHRYNGLPSNIFDGRDILLNVGGMNNVPDWYNVNSQESSYGEAAGQVDIVRNMYDLEGFPEGSVSAIYSSHTLEHNSFGDGSLYATLREWHRVLKDGAYVMISVPDLPTIFNLLLDEKRSLQEQFMLTRMIFGGQQNEFDYHLMGFDLQIMSGILEEVGFCNCQKVDHFTVAKDTSWVQMGTTYVSLNVVARKCLQPSDKSLSTMGRQSDVDRLKTHFNELLMKYIIL